MHKRFLLILGLTFLPLSLLNALTLKRGPYLQMGNTTSVSVRWRTDVNTESVVRYGTSADALTKTLTDLRMKTEHEIRLTELQPNTKYYYAVGDVGATLASGADCYFVTAPTGAKPTRVWLLGDPGTGDTNAKAVRDAYYKFTGTRHTDLWLMNGDNAYNNGTDFEFTAKLFNIYGAMLKKSVLLSAYGNHDAASADAATQTGPYFAQHTFPTKAEMGGVASGTEAYYSADYGNIHFIFVDTSESSRSADSAQVAWLKKDLAANRKDWTIVTLHHPPYTRGTENSDSSATMTQVRQVLNPIFEQYGVDLVIGGHAHCYQRSYLVSGHYGKMATFDQTTMVVQPGDGRVGGNGAYVKDLGDKAYSGTVYVVAGASGKVGGEEPNLPVMYKGFSVLGSLVMDFNGLQLDVAYIDRSGVKRDYFTMKKTGTAGEPAPTPVPANEAPSVQLTSPAASVSMVAPGNLVLAATATDADGSVAKVEFLGGGVVLGTDTTSPYSHTWMNVPVGAQTITARATDNDGATRTSASVLVNVTAEPTAAQAVTSFTLMDATTNQPVPGYETIAAGQKIYRSTLPASLSVRVNTNPSKVGSVRIGWNGNASYRVESTAPYELFGGPVGDTYGGTIANGTHTFAGTPYTEAGAKGTVGTSASVTFTIVDGAPPAPAPEPEPEPAPAGQAVVGFTLMNADTNAPIAGYENVASGAVISRAALPTTRLSVRVNTNPSKVGSVKIGWNANASYRVESTAPYELFGGPVGDTYGGTIANGTHTFTGTPYTEAGAKGTVGASKSVTFTIVDGAVPAPAPEPEPEPAPAGQAVVGFTLMNADTNAPIAGYENVASGAVISRAALPTTRLSVRVNTNSSKVGSVRIGWNGNASYRVESTAPYELFGGPVGDTYGGTIANGTHTFTGTPYTEAGAKGTAGTSGSVTLTIQ